MQRGCCPAPPRPRCRDRRTRTRRAAAAFAPPRAGQRCCSSCPGSPWRFPFFSMMAALRSVSTLRTAPDYLLGGVGLQRAENLVVVLADFGRVTIGLRPFAVELDRQTDNF